jgi:hypothetical protein
MQKVDEPKRPLFSSIGYLLFAVFEVEAKKRGTLEVF